MDIEYGPGAPLPLPEHEYARLVDSAKSWLCEITWTNVEPEDSVEEDIVEMGDRTILRQLGQSYDGGLVQFLIDEAGISAHQC